VALCVHPDLDYVTIEDVKTGNRYILAQSRIVQLYKKETEYKVCAYLDVYLYIYTHVYNPVQSCIVQLYEMHGVVLREGDRVQGVRVCLDATNYLNVS
jgi:hypothetical protein